jgi:DNA-directed RNA polymerase specialized sigma24 family protein
VWINRGVAQHADVADLDYRAIADVLEVEVGTVSATLSAAHRTLRKEIQEVQK